LLSAVGSDAVGETIMSMAADAGLRTDGLAVLNGHRSAEYVAIHGPDGRLICGIADMDVHEALDWSCLYKAHSAELHSAAIVVCDGNMPSQLLADVATFCANESIPLWFEPVSDTKCVRAVDAGILHAVTYISPNESELGVLASRITGVSHKGVDLDATAPRDLVDALSPQVEVVLNQGVHTVLVSVGHLGVVIGTKGPAHLVGGVAPAVHYFHVAAEAVGADEFKNSNGAGDSFVGAAIAVLATGGRLEDAVNQGTAGQRRGSPPTRRLYGGAHTRPHACRDGCSRFELHVRSSRLASDHRGVVPQTVKWTANRAFRLTQSPSRS